jgi:AGCS family alanine or glycine:cation symporter
MIIVSAFALSSLFTYAYYGTKCLNFLIGTKKGRYYNVIYVFSITFAAVASVDLVINLIDLSFALMVIPNMIALFILAPKVNQAAKTYFNNRKNR